MGWELLGRNRKFGHLAFDFATLEKAVSLSMGGGRARCGAAAWVGFGRRPGGGAWWRGH